MCFFNESSTILLLLLTILLATMPTITTTTSSASPTLGIRITTTDLIRTAGGGVTGGGGFPQQPKQQHPQQRNGEGLHAKSMAYVDLSPIVLPSTGTELLPSGHDDNFIASLVGAGTNHNNRVSESTGVPATGSVEQSNHHQNHRFTMDYNGLEARPIDSDGEDGDLESSSPYPPPVFDFGMPRNITARSGQIAAINCRVENLGDKSVSWIRKRDLHILTAGILTYTSDERFKVIRTPDSKDWTLHVKYAQPRDSGIYECQVNTEPKISMAFRLNVIVTPPDAKAIITGPSDLYVKVGSAITLTCHVKQPSSSQDIGPIYWYRGPYILTPFVAHPNDAAIDLQRISMESKLGEKLQSRLRIANAQTADSGNYTCMPTTADAASVMVNVINDESPAAMQKSCANRPLIGILLWPVASGLYQLHSALRASATTTGVTISRTAAHNNYRIIVTCIIAISTAVRWLWPVRLGATKNERRDGYITDWSSTAPEGSLNLSAKQGPSYGPTELENFVQS